MRPVAAGIKENGRGVPLQSSYLSRSSSHSSRNVMVVLYSCMSNMFSTQVAAFKGQGPADRNATDKQATDEECAPTNVHQLKGIEAERNDMHWQLKMQLKSKPSIIESTKSGRQQRAPSRGLHIISGRPSACDPRAPTSQEQHKRPHGVAGVADELHRHLETKKISFGAEMMTSRCANRWNATSLTRT